MSNRDTIAAIATAAGRAGVGVVRISGTGVPQVAQQITGRELVPRRATRSSFRDAGGEAIDEGLALYFPAPHSYTGEHVLELQGHGGPVVLRMLLQRCLELGARLAEPGEFTRRAFLGGKLDLAQAEGVIDLIESSTAQAARCAMRSLTGEFSTRIQELDRGVVELRALVEAALDFPEEEIDFLERAGAMERLERVRMSLSSVLDAARQGSLLREGMHVVIAGQPNVGKSSLLNRLAGEELAIVTDIPGTTRDPIRQAINLAGIPLHVVDTAGLRDSADPVERIGVERAWGAIGSADVVLAVVDASRGVTEADRVIFGRLPKGVPQVRVMNKIDLGAVPPRVESTAEATTVWLSAKSGAGLDSLRETLLRIVGWSERSESVFLARERHLEALGAADRHLERAAGQGGQWELLAEELRLAHHALCAITGEYTSDDLLGEIFSRFCIGK